ncbi:MAG: metallophosphoesterase [Eubacterium sp.]|nr:metallophosphoesterase [Eubacterium sp.]
MKRALLISDSHGDNQDMLRVIREHAGKVDAVFHMGDLQGAEDLVNKEASKIGCFSYIVKGNCDSNLKLKGINIIDFDGKRILTTHGHMFGGYGGPDVDALWYTARENEADVVVFGHTHKPFCEVVGGILICNPGSISRPRQMDATKTYAVLTVDEGKVSVEFYDVSGNKYKKAVGGA